ncbi:MAG: sulfatase-like hydrolase/transferase [Bacteroidales bacterium]|nr:MAG: sulfatase-like hydrolase/transferase [Bacteroidales bacterium]
MKNRLLFILKYSIFWMLTFAVFRLVFIAYQLKQTLQISFADFINILVRGAWMDLSLTGYIILLTSIFIGIMFFVNKKWLKGYLAFQTILLLTIISLISISDIELYRNWGFRIDATPLLYLKTPKEAMASMETFMIIIFVIVTILTIIGLYWAYRKWVASTLNNAENGKWWYAPTFIAIAGTMMLPIRGGLGIAPMNPGKVYFSSNTYCNHAALNAPWNMMYSVSKSGTMNKRYPDNIDANKAKVLFNELMKNENDSTIVLKTDRPNIVLILLESFSSKIIEPLGGKHNVTPNFNELSNKGLLFTRMYASGDRSDKGIISVLAGFPAQPIQSVIKYPTKSRKLATISGALVDAGYNAAFYYGGDPDFANIRSFLYSAKFSRIITQEDFPRNYRNSKWGVHDEHVFKYLLNDIDTAKGPFFKMFFTLSSHEPFEIPTKSKFPGNDAANQFISSAFYTDSCLGNFFDEAKKHDWYNNTLFILIADHGHRHFGKIENYATDKFSIPMLWLGGALQCEPQKINKICSQIDIASTILNQLNLSDSNFVFSKNILNTNTKPFAYYVFNNGYGFVSQTDTIIYDHVSRQYIMQNGVEIEKTSEKASAFFYVYQDVFLGL